jgi:hypothetical protein
MNEFEQSATLVKNDLKAHDFNGAWKEFSREVLSLEKRRTSQSDGAKMEGEYFAEVLNQSEELKKLGFPSAALHQNGSTLEMVFSDSSQRIPNLEWTSFTLENQKKNSHDLTVQEVTPAPELKAMTAKEDKTGKPLDAGIQGEEIIWGQWQERLNKAISLKLHELMKGHSFPAGYRADIDYHMDKNTGFSWKSTTNGSPEFRKVIEAAVDQPLLYHPELREFPAGTKYQTYDRRASFGIGKESYTTGPTRSEFIKK